MNLTNHFLLAMPSMADPYFNKSLTYICEHTEQGALGVVINRPIDLKLKTLFEQIDVKLNDDSLVELPVYFGGPVQTDRGFVLHQPIGHWQSTLVVENEVGLTTSKDILEALANGEGPQNVLVTLGYAGWAPGQLEHEISKNGWLTVRSLPKVIFDIPPEERYAAAMQMLGIDFANLSEQVGHA